MILTFLDSICIFSSKSYTKKGRICGPFQSQWMFATSGGAESPKITQHGQDVCSCDDSIPV